MAFGVFMYRFDSKYHDEPSERYQFPRQYLGRARQCEGDWVLYLEPSKVRNTRGYFAVAKVARIIEDPNSEGMFLALIEPGSYLDFGEAVPFREGGSVLEAGLLNEHGILSGRAQAAVRPIASVDFARIVSRGLERSAHDLPRSGATSDAYGFCEPLSEFAIPEPRLRMDMLMNRAVRDRNFRKTVLRAYGERCAITGLRLINGGGRAEVEAAHIMPVEHGGPDIVRNGLALSGTVHWMFDRGLMSIADDHSILVSRQVNDEGAVRSLINTTGRLLSAQRDSEKPGPGFLRWHRANCFKH